MGPLLAPPGRGYWGHRWAPGFPSAPWAPFWPHRAAVVLLNPSYTNPAGQYKPTFDIRLTLKRLFRTRQSAHAKRKLMEAAEPFTLSDCSLLPTALSLTLTSAYAK